MAIPKSELPDTDFAAIYKEDDDSIISKILVRKKVRDHLIAKKMLHSYDFSPIILINDQEQIDVSMEALRDCVKDTFVSGYFQKKLDSWKFPEPIKRHYDELYEQYKKKDMQELVITEKSALQLMRNLKKEYPNDFRKALPKKCGIQLQDSRLAPYYFISDGGNLGSEYRYYSTCEMEQNISIFCSLQAKEDFDLPEYTLFGVSIDGEYILLLKNGSVVQYQMGNPEFIEEWENIQTFFYRALL